MKVGVPRALLFHSYGEGWLGFLDELGVEAVVSRETTGRTIELGTNHADNESCLPVKVFAGHLLSLEEQADLVLVPRVVSQGPRMKSCPKYLGLPDMARAIAPVGTQILSPSMDLGERRGDWRRDWLDLARGFGADRTQASAALRRMLESLDRPGQAHYDCTGRGAKVGIAGHVYNIRDDRVSLGLLERVRGLGAEPVTVDQVPRTRVRRQLRTLKRKIRWDYESRMVGAVLDWVRTESVSGIVHVNSFACGPGSMIGALLEDEIRKRDGVPFISITLDEHSSETGMLTRVEAFLDMLGRRPEYHAHLGPPPEGGGSW